MGLDDGLVHGLCAAGLLGRGIRLAGGGCWNRRGAGNGYTRVSAGLVPIIALANGCIGDGRPLRAVQHAHFKLHNRLPVGLQIPHGDFQCPAGNAIGYSLAVHPHRAGHKFQASGDDIGNRDILPVCGGVCAVLNLDSISENVAGLYLGLAGCFGKRGRGLAAVNGYAGIGELDVLPVGAFHNGGVGDV